MKIVIGLLITFVLCAPVFAAPCGPEMLQFASSPLLPKHLVTELAQLVMSFENFSENDAVNEIYRRAVDQKLKEVKTFLSGTSEMLKLKTSGMDDEGFEKEVEKKILEILDVELKDLRKQHAADSEVSQHQETQQRATEFEAFYVEEAKKLQNEYQAITAQYGAAVVKHATDLRRLRSNESEIDDILKKHKIYSRGVVLPRLSDGSDNYKLWSLGQNTTSLTLAERNSKKLVADLEGPLATAKQNFLLSQERLQELLGRGKTP